jgi:menaquinone-9 beta-reductase
MTSRRGDAMIDPTLDAADAARRVWDAVVVGAGPAGTMVARELARDGSTVLLVDKALFPRYKVCGGCLNPRSLRVLQQAGLDHLTQRLRAVPLTRFQLGTRGAIADVPLPPGAGVSREAFDAALVREAIAAGAAFLPGASASLLPVQSRASTRVLRLRLGGRVHTVECRVAVACNGLAGGLEEHQPAEGNGDATHPWERGSRVGAGVMIPAPVPGYEPGTIYMACAAEGYVGQTIVEDGRVDMAAAFDPIAVKRAGGTGELAEQVLDRAGFPPYPGLARLAWKGTPHLTRRAKALGGHRLFVLGDAAGYIEPFTGEGMAWALAGAALVAPLARRGGRLWDPELLAQWRGAYHRKVTRRQAICRITAEMLRRPLATGITVRALSVAPVLAQPLFRIMYRE